MHYRQTLQFMELYFARLNIAINILQQKTQGRLKRDRQHGKVLLSE